MEVIGKIIMALPPVQGTSKAGNPWKKREYVLETQETFPRKIFFDFFNDRADQYPLNVGDDIKLSFDIDSREYQGRWFVSIRGWKAEPANAAATTTAATQPYGQPAAAPYGQPAPAAYGQPAPAQDMPGAMPPPPAVDAAPGATDDLPF